MHRQKKYRRSAGPRGFGEYEGGATVEEIAAFASAVSGADTSKWPSFVTPLHENAFNTFQTERLRSLNNGQFYDGENGAFFVIVVNSILANIDEGAKKCLLRLISMDPITTFFIFTDPIRADEQLNRSIIEALRKGIKHQGRSEAHIQYKQFFSEACTLCSSDYSIASKCRSDLAPLMTNREDTSNLQKYIAKCYSECCSGGGQRDFCACLSPQTRSRLGVYDSFRVGMLTLFIDLYPFKTVSEILNKNPFVDDEQRKHTRLRGVVESLLKTNTTIYSDGGTLDTLLDKYKAYQFCLSDFFCYTPSASGTALESVQALQQAISASRPFNVNTLYESFFTHVF
jgi:hypothetical protein